jgi:hypothetical protein
MLVVFVREPIWNHIYDVSDKTVATGLLGMMVSLYRLSWFFFSLSQQLLTSVKFIGVARNLKRGVLFEISFIPAPPPKKNSLSDYCIFRFDAYINKYIIYTLCVYI